MDLDRSNSIRNPTNIIKYNTNIVSTIQKLVKMSALVLKLHYKSLIVVVFSMHITNKVCVYLACKIPLLTMANHNLGLMSKFLKKMNAPF